MVSVVKPGCDALWAQLEALTPNIKGEIIDGELHTQPRARFRHARANGFLGHHLGGGLVIGGTERLQITRQLGASVQVRDTLS